MIVSIFLSGLISFSMFVLTLMTLPFRVKPLDWQKKTVPSVLSG